MVVFLKILVTLFASVYGLDNGVARTPPSESIGTLFITHYNNPTLVYVMICDDIYVIWYTQWDG